MFKPIKRIVLGIENHCEVLEYLAFRHPGKSCNCIRTSKSFSSQIEIADQRIFDAKYQIDKRLTYVQKELRMILNELEHICEVPYSSTWSKETRKKHHVRKARRMGIIP